MDLNISFSIIFNSNYLKYFYILIILYLGLIKNDVNEILYLRIKILDDILFYKQI